MRKAWIGAVLALTVTLGACTGNDDEAAPSGAATGAPSTVNVAATVASATAGATLAAPLPVIGSTDTTVLGKAARIDLNEVRVTDEVMTVSWTVTDTRTSGDDWNLGYAFAQGGVLGDDKWTANGVYVIDPKNAQRYLSAETADGDCVCTNTLSAQLGPGRSVVMTNTLKAPPADVSDVVVMIPFAKALPAKVVR